MRIARETWTGTSQPMAAAYIGRASLEAKRLSIVMNASPSRASLHVIVHGNAQKQLKIVSPGDIQDAKVTTTSGKTSIKTYCET